jgi:hypothetical protein
VKTPTIFHFIRVELLLYHSILLVVKYIALLKPKGHWRCAELKAEVFNPLMAHGMEHVTLSKLSLIPHSWNGLI